MMSRVSRGRWSVTLGILAVISLMLAVLQSHVALAYTGNEPWPSACAYSNWNEGQLSRTFFSNSCPHVDQILPIRGNVRLEPNGALKNQDCISYGYVIPRKDDGCNNANQPTSPDALANVVTKQDLYNKLKGYYDGNDKWASKGSAFVVRTLLGQSVGSSTVLSDADWSQLLQRLVLNPAVTIGSVQSESIGSNTTSVYTSGNDPYNIFTDDRINSLDFSRYYGAAVDIPVLTLSYPGGNYKLEVKCANPLGGLGGLPNFTASYTMAPVISDVSPNPVEAGNKVTVNSQINYSGNVSTRPTQWQINQIVVKQGGVEPSNRGGGTSAADVDPCKFYGKPPVDCNGFGATGNGTYSNDVTLPSQTSPSLDYPVGTEICYGLSVQPRSYDSDEWSHSALVCTVIGIKPKIQITSGDLRVGRTFNGANLSDSKVDTGISVKPNGTFGSWVEYGIFAPGGIAMASAGGLATGNGGASNGSVLTSYPANKLTFANIAPPCAYGCYSADSLGSIPDVVGKYITAATPVMAAPGSPIDAGGLSSGVYAYSGDVVLSGATIQQGKWAVVRATGTVTITGNIQYTNDLLKSNQDIPQLIIIANRINIAPTVARVDSWLVAKSSGAAGSGGVIDTCVLPGGYANDTYTSGLTGKNCSEVLTVNGPVMAEKLWLRRTGGSGTGGNSGDPAEIFNLRPDAYLWAQTQVTASSRIQTTYTKEMAPRF